MYHQIGHLLITYCFFTESSLIHWQSAEATIRQTKFTSLPYKIYWPNSCKIVAKVYLTEHNLCFIKLWYCHTWIHIRWKICWYFMILKITALTSSQLKWAWYIFLWLFCGKLCVLFFPSSEHHLLLLISLELKSGGGKTICQVHCTPPSSASYKKKLNDHTLLRQTCPDNNHSSPQ